MIWEYRIERQTFDGSESESKQLSDRIEYFNRIGADGWELVLMSIVSAPSSDEYDLFTTWKRCRDAKGRS